MLFSDSQVFSLALPIAAPAFSREEEFDDNANRRTAEKEKQCLIFYESCLRVSNGSIAFSFFFLTFFLSFLLLRVLFRLENTNLVSFSSFALFFYFSVKPCLNRALFV